MKRSEINAAVKEMENIVSQSPLSVILHQKSGKKRAVIMTKSEIICWDGILQITA